MYKSYKSYMGMPDIHNGHAGKLRTFTLDRLDGYTDPILLLARERCCGRGQSESLQLNGSR